jgi:hypothetical protein
MENKKTHSYSGPEVTKVELDNEISLQLASDSDPLGEPGNWSQAPINFEKDMFAQG